MYISINQFLLLLNLISIFLALYFYKYDIQIIVLIICFAKTVLLLINAAYLSDILTTKVWSFAEKFNCSSFQLYDCKHQDIL